MNLRTEFLSSSDEARPAPALKYNPANPSRSVEAGSAAKIAGTMQQLIDDLPEEIALLDENGTIIAANRTWKDVCKESDNGAALPGHNYRDLCERKAHEGYGPAALAGAAFDEILAGERESWQLTYNGGDRWNGRDYRFDVHRIGSGGDSLIMVTRTDLTELLELRRVKDEFTNSIIEGQAVERQRMARELHDSTSQLLTTIGLLLGRLKYQSPDVRALNLVEELQGLVSETQQEIRSISYLAHPPAIRQMGLIGAIKSLAEGFGRRTGLEASFELKGEAVQISPAAEGVLYRIAQEALSNVHRHAQATGIRVQLSFRGAAAHLLITDNGVGISREALAGTGSVGVGLASMRSRLSEIGGRLSVRRLSPGTAIVATVPSQAGHKTV